MGRLGTDVVSAGVGGMRGSGSGAIELSGVTGAISRALLYWHGPTSQPGGNATVLFNGQSVTGTSLGLDYDNNWGFDNSEAFKADVTDLVTGDGVYGLSNFTQGDADVNGASLIVFFNDGAYANNVDVVLFEGNHSNDDDWNAAFADIEYQDGPATLELHVSDGQEFLDGELLLNGDILEPAGQIFSGNSLPGGAGPNGNGNLWDIKSFDIAPFLNPGVQTLTLTSPMLVDYLSLVVGLVMIRTAAPPPTVQIEAVKNTSEVLFAPAGEFVVTRTGDISQPLEVTIQVGGTAAASDYVAIGYFGTAFTFAANEPSRTIYISATQDTAIEKTETVDITLVANPAKYVVGPAASATVKIFDNDTTVSIVANDPLAHEALNGQAPDPGQFTITRQGDLDEPLEVYFQRGGSTASVEDFDELFTLSLPFFLIPAGTASISVTVTPHSDTTNRGDYFLGTTNREFVLVEGREQLGIQLIDSWYMDQPVYTVNQASYSAQVKVVDTLYQGNNNQPDAESILQGDLGCFFASVVAGIIRQRGPQVIMNLIQDLNDGRYTVTLPGHNPVTFEEERYSFNSPFTAPLGYSNGVWLPVLAHGYELTTGNPISGNATTDQVFLGLTGNNNSRQDNFTDITQEQLHNILAAAMQNQRLVIAGTLNSPALTLLGIVPDHGYTVWGYDANTRMVTLRNPHGIGEFGQWNRNLERLPVDGVDDGIFQLPLRTFYALFSFIQREL